LDPILFYLKSPHEHPERSSIPENQAINQSPERESVPMNQTLNQSHQPLNQTMNFNAQPRSLLVSPKKNQQNQAISSDQAQDQRINRYLTIISVLTVLIIWWNIIFIEAFWYILHKGYKLIF